MNKFKNNKMFFLASILFAQIILFYWGSSIEEMIAHHEKFFEFQKEGHQFLFSSIPFSVGDVLYIVLLLVLFLFLLKTKFIKRAYFLVVLNIFYFFYQIFWGLLYFQRPLEACFPMDEISSKQVEFLTMKYLERCKSTRQKVSEDENGIFKIRNLEQVKQEILKNQNKLPKVFSVKKPTNIDVFKPSVFSAIMSYTGIAGYYNPFSSEAQYNNGLPHSQLPFTLAHESAHQLGFAREEEANFIGYLLGVDAQNSDVRYSTQWFVLKSLLYSQAEHNPEFVENVINSFSDAMKRDYNYEKYHYEKHSGRLYEIFGKMNDWFLKFNQQDGAITYGYFVCLLVLYETNRGRN